MRIGLISCSFAPEMTGIGPYSSELAQALAERGHDVRVVTTFPFYPTWVPSVPPGTIVYRFELHGRVHVTRCRIFVPRNPNPFKRVCHELSWLLAATPVVLTQLKSVDVWLVVSPAFGSAVLGSCLTRLFRARAHLHIQDVVPDVALESGQIARPWARHFAAFAARWTYRGYRSCSVLSDGMERALRRYIDAGWKGRIVLAPNWPRNLTDVGKAALPDELKERSYVLFSGSFGRKQELSALVEAASMLEKRGGPLIVVLGDGPGRELIRSAKANLVWLGLATDSTYSALVRNALAGLVTLVPGMSNSVVPSKLVGYLAAGRPVVVAADPSSEAVRIVSAEKCGIAIAPGRPDLLANAVMQLRDDQEGRESMGASGRAFVQQHWAKAPIVDRIEQALRRLVGLERTTDS